MKTSNVEGHGTKATDATRGRRSALVAGSKGAMWRDASTESVGQIREMTVYGAEFVDHEDGTGDLIIGGSSEPGPGGGSGGDTGGASIPIQMLNNSGVNLDVGAVVIVDDTADDAVTTTTSAESTAIVGIVMAPIEAGAIGPVLFNGYAASVDVTGTVVRGDYLETSTTAGVGQASATREAGTFGVVTAGADITEFVADSAITEEDASVTSLAITMPASVTDPDSAGRLLFLALWRDPSVTSNPTITGWTRIGSTSGFWYYYRVCTVGDTASATWTTASPAAAIVALLDPVVASIEDHDYDAATTAASVTGLDGSPHYALAVLQGAVAVPAGWTALPSVAIAHDPGGVTDLALSGTVTNDPANTMDWTDPTNVNDGDESTYADFLPHAAGETFRLKLDLGSAGTVSESWVRTAYAMDLEYSTDDITYNALPGVNWAAPTTHNGFPNYRRVTWTGGDITARYWRLGRTSAGSGSGERITTWELTGTHDLDVEGMLVGQYAGRATTVTSPFTGASAATDGIIVLNLYVEPKPSAILYGPDLGGGGSVSEILDIPTAETDTTLRLAPDGVGGVEWAVTTGGGLGWFLPDDYGAAGDGTTDDTTPVADAVAAYNAAGGGVLYFPKKYLVTAGVTLTEPGIVLGGGRGSPSGAGTTSEVICASATAVIFTVQDHVQFRDIQVRSTAATPTAGALVAVTSTGDSTSFSGCMFRGGWIGLDIQEGGGQGVHNCWFTGQMKYALKIRNISSPDGGDHAISDSWFYAFDARTPDAAIRIESAGGSKITNCKINSLNASGAYVRGIDLSATVASSSILIIHGNSIENVSGDAIHLATSSFSWDMVNIFGNQIGNYANTTGNAIEVTCANIGEIDGLVIANNLFRQTGGGTPVAISLTKVNDIFLGGNVYESGFAGGNLTTSGCTNLVNHDLIGATPSGELGGTWDAITVDATHSGSAHTDFIAKAIVDAKGDLIAATAADTVARVAVGTDGQYLKANSAASAGVSWDTPTGGGGIGEILISDSPSTPLIFADLLQNEAQDDLLYADP